MKIPLVILFFSLAVITALPATPLQFADHNFGFELPTDWNQLPSPSPQILVMAESPDHARKFLISVMDVPVNERATAAGDMRAGAKHSMAAQGWQFDAEQPLTVKGLSFISMTAHQPSSGTSMFIYSTAAGDQAYMLAFPAKAGLGMSDPDMQSILQSFHLLSSSAELLPLTSTSQPSAAYRTGYIFGNLFVVVGIPALIIWFIYRSWSKRRARRSSRRR